MSALTLVETPIPVLVGDVVAVDDPIATPSGRTVPRGRYLVRAVEWTPDEHRQRGPYRLSVEARLDCAGLPETHRPGSEYRQRKGLPAQPACARPTTVYVYPGQFTRYRSGQIETLPDHPLQTD